MSELVVKKINCKTVQQWYHCIIAHSITNALAATECWTLMVWKQMMAIKNHEACFDCLSLVFWIIRSECHNFDETSTLT